MNPIFGVRVEKEKEVVEKALNNIATAEMMQYYTIEQIAMDRAVAELAPREVNFQRMGMDDPFRWRIGDRVE